MIYRIFTNTVRFLDNTTFIVVDEETGRGFLVLNNNDIKETADYNLKSCERTVASGLWREVPREEFIDKIVEQANKLVGPIVTIGLNTSAPTETAND